MAGDIGQRHTITENGKARPAMGKVSKLWRKPEKKQQESRLLQFKLFLLLTPWCRILLEQLTCLQLVKKFPAFHRTRRFITALTSVRHLSLSWISPIQSIYPHPTSWRSILSTPRSPQWSLFLRFPHQDPIHLPLLTHTRHMSSPSHSSRFYHPHNIG